MELQILLDRYRKTGRVAFHYPRKKQVSLNGGRLKSEAEALKYLKEFFSK